MKNRKRSHVPPKRPPASSSRNIPRGYERIVDANQGVPVEPSPRIPFMANVYGYLKTQDDAIRYLERQSATLREHMFNEMDCQKEVRAEEKSAGFESNVLSTIEDHNERLARVINEFNYYIERVIGIQDKIG